MDNISRRRFLVILSSLSLSYPSTVIAVSSGKNNQETNGPFPATKAVLKTAYITEWAAYENYMRFAAPQSMRPPGQPAIFVTCRVPIMPEWTDLPEHHADEDLSHLTLCLIDLLARLSENQKWIYNLAQNFSWHRIPLCGSYRPRLGWWYYRPIRPARNWSFLHL